MNTKDNEVLNLIGTFVVGMIVGAFISFATTLIYNTEAWEIDLIERGHAEYYINEHHNRRWRFIEEEKLK